jgi:transposase
VPYTFRFKEEMLRQLLGPDAVSATELSRRTGVSQPTLSRWLLEARKVAAVSSENKPKGEAPPPPKRRTAAEMLRLIVEAEGLEGEALAALLRREGVYDAELKAWREAAYAAISPTTEGATSPQSAAQRKEVAAIKGRVKQLERELRRKDRALAEAAALLVLEKKLQALGWDSEQSQGDEDDESDEKSGR